MNSSRTFFLLALACALTVVAQAIPPLQCNTRYVDDVPPRIRKICIALSTLYELGSAMENYVNDNVPVMHDGNLLMDNGVKRQDADHVFLRFGRSAEEEAAKMPNPQHVFLRIGKRNANGDAASGTSRLDDVEKHVFLRIGKRNANGDSAASGTSRLEDEEGHVYLRFGKRSSAASKAPRLSAEEGHKFLRIGKGMVFSP